MLRIAPNLNAVAHPKQYGCTKGCSTETAICALIGSVQNAQNHCKHVMAVFYDIAGAFNSVWWPLALKCLAEARIPSNIYKLMTSYFQNRRAIMHTHTALIQTEITRGCPQGSVLGAPIWNIVFADLLRTLSDGGWDVFAYVDDLAVVVRANSIADLVTQAELCSTHIKRWCDNAKLRLAAEKTQAIISKGGGDARHPTRFNVDGVKIEEGLQAKYLGVTLNSRLSPGAHVADVMAKVVRLSASIRGLSGPRWGTTFQERVKYYSMVFLPTVLYAASTWWDKPTKEMRARVNRMQRGALIAMTRAYRTVSTDALQVLAGCEPLDLVLDARVAIIGVKWPQRRSARVRQELEELLAQPLTASRKMSRIEEWVAMQWQERWESSNKGRVTYEYFPSTVRQCTAYNEDRRAQFNSSQYWGLLADLLATKEAFHRLERFAKAWAIRRGEGEELVETERRSQAR
ncbi:hypothetical protein GE061_019020 [Apolygus lucorum]|uniref:Reverse transcriptase domain-containing protein n=1 Tax=Apolygus lucorum TaxID=248454 RepID=A0A8S9X797_APOLU|nr:hypothetical protein GE061_019020 [Apolygus lucorum]